MLRLTMARLGTAPGGLKLAAQEPRVGRAEILALGNHACGQA